MNAGTLLTLKSKRRGRKWRARGMLGRTFSRYGALSFAGSGACRACCSGTVRGGLDIVWKDCWSGRQRRGHVN